MRNASYPFSPLVDGPLFAAHDTYFDLAIMGLSSLKVETHIFFSLCPLQTSPAANNYNYFL